MNEQLKNLCRLIFTNDDKNLEMAKHLIIGLLGSESTKTLIGACNAYG